MSVAASSTRKTSKVWDSFELEGNGNVFCKLCKVKLAYNNFTGAMRNHIQYRHVCVSLEASQSQMSNMSHYNLPLRSAILSALSIPLNEDPLRWWCGISRLFSKLSACLQLFLCMPVTSVPAECGFFFKCRIASSPVFRQTTLTC